MSLFPRGHFSLCLFSLSFGPLSFPGWWSHVLNYLSLFTSGVLAVRRWGTFSLAASAQTKTLKTFDMLQGHPYTVIGKDSDFPGSRGLRLPLWSWHKPQHPQSCQ